MIFQGYLYTFVYIFCVLIASLIIKNIFKNDLLSKKFIHILVSFSWLIMYTHFKSTIHLIIFPLGFIILNYISYKYNIFKLEGKEKTLGTVYYPISFFILSLITYFMPDFYISFGIGVFCMGLADGLAPIFASLIESMKFYNGKTLAGSTIVFLLSLIVIVSFNYHFKIDLNIFKILFLATFSMLLELVSTRGRDNLSVPIGVAVMSYLIGGI